MDLSEANLNSLKILEFFDLSSLISLNLDNNNIKTLKLINRMESIKEISIKNNPVDVINISSEISSFDVVTSFDSKKIKVLELSNNRFVNFELKGNYENLKIFKLINNLNEIDDVSIRADFNRIGYMDFSNSKIRKFSIYKNLPECFLRLNLSVNYINFLKLPYKIFEKKNDGSYIKVELEKNNLPDLMLSALKKKSLPERYRELRDIFFDVIEVNRVKLIFLGNTGVGKTTLYKVLKHKDNDYFEYEGNSTEGINIFNYEFYENDKLIEVKGFDFGGQDYYHNTHYSFFSTNALYVFLWGNNQYIYHRSYFDRKNSDNESKTEITYPLNYWLGSVSYFINREKKLLESKFFNSNRANEENVRLHLIQNPNCSSNVYAPEYDLDRLTLKNRYPFISGFETFPSLTEGNFLNYTGQVKNNLKEIIKNYSKAESYPKILAKIEEKLKITLSRKKQFIISIDHIQQIFFKENKEIGWDGNFIQILEWLDITMSIYWISDEKLNNFVKQSGLGLEKLSILSEYAVLDLSKLNEIIHNILSVDKVDKGSLGFYKKNEIDSVIGEFGVGDVADYVSAFMLYNKIYFEAPNKLDGEELYIAPNYLNNEVTLAEEIFLDSFDKPFIEYRFEDFYHVNIFTEVLVKYKSNLSSNNVLKDVDYLLWRNKAVFFENLDSDLVADNRKKQPLVLLDFDLGEIIGMNSMIPLDDNSNLRKPSIRISTYSKNRNPISEEFLKDIMIFIDNQLVGYNYKKFALAPNEVEYVDVESIDNNLDSFDGNSTDLFTCNNRIYRSADFRLFTNRKVAMRKIFISHSTDDYREVQEFITHLHPLKREGLIDHWHCSQLIPSTIWDTEIQKHLWDSDIICMLISPSWLANDYIFNKELMVAIERKELFKSSHNGRDIIIFPIIIKQCLWTNINILSKFQAAPQKALSLSSFADRNEAWCDIVRKLKDVLNLMDNPSYEPEIAGRLGQIYVNQYEGKLTKHNS
ncbi:TIR domain-containing protein [Acinetobacter sp.]